MLQIHYNTLIKHPYRGHRYVLQNVPIMQVVHVTVYWVEKSSLFMGDLFRKLFKHTTTACGGIPILRVVTLFLRSINKSLPIVCFHCQFYGGISVTGPALSSGLMTIATQRPVFGFTAIPYPPFPTTTTSRCPVLFTVLKF